MSKKSITISAALGVTAALALAVPATAAPSFSYTVCHPTGPVQTVAGEHVVWQVRIDDCVTRYLGGLFTKTTEKPVLVVVSSTPK